MAPNGTYKLQGGRPTRMLICGVGDEFAMRTDALLAYKDIVDAYDKTS